MKKILILVLFLIAFLNCEAQQRFSVLGGTTLIDSTLTTGKHQYIIQNDSSVKILSNVIFPNLFYSLGDNIFSGSNTFSLANTFNGVNTFYNYSDFRRKLGLDTIRLNSNTILNKKTLSLSNIDNTVNTTLSNSMLNFKSSGNDTIGTGDNYGLFFKTNNSNKMKIDSLGKIKFYTSYLDINNGNNATFGTTDDYSLMLKTSDTNRITIDNRGSIYLRDTIRGKSYGTIYKGTTRFLHNTWNPYVGLGGTSYNLFMGIDAGNFTVGQTTNNAGYTYEGNYNVGIGTWALKSLTTGYYNFMIGVNSGPSITSGSSNFGMGNYNLTNLTTGVGNVALGYNAMQYSGSGVWGNVMVGASSGIGVNGTSNYWQNTALGSSTMSKLTTGVKNITIGSNAGNSLTSGSYNIIISPQSYDNYGQYYNRGKTTTGSYNILIGDSTVRVYNTNGSIGLSIDSTASRHLSIGGLFYARDIYTDTLKAGIGIRDDSVTARWHIKAGSTQRHTAPLKFNTGSLLTTPEVGAVEFLTDDLYYTQTTNTKRNRISIDRSDTVSTYASTVTVTMQGSLKQVTVSVDCTLNATGGVAGSTMILYLNNTAGVSKVITLGTNIKSMGTVTLNSTAGGNEGTVTLVCLDGTNWIETARAIGM